MLMVVLAAAPPMTALILKSAGSKESASLGFKSLATFVVLSRAGVTVASTAEVWAGMLRLYAPLPSVLVVAMGCSLIFPMLSVV
jgi:hypothetical protein